MIDTTNLSVEARQLHLSQEGRAGDPVVAVVVVAADATELVAGQLVGPLVVGCRLLLAA